MGLMRKLTSLIVASSLVLGSVGMALAAPTEEQVNEAFNRLSTYGIVKGRLQADGTTDPALGEPITRAELLKVVVMGLGYTEEQVNVLKGAPSFDDVALDQWYAPYVALAKNIAEQKGFQIGYPDGTFRPNNQVTAIEALVFVLKLLGITPVTGENWVQGNIDLAVQNGVITSADAEALLDAATQPANRGLAFAIVDTAFMTYAVDGKNVYQRNVDKEAPVLTVDPVPEAVQAATVTITGTVTGAVELYAGSDAIAFDAEGKFSYEAALEVGLNTIVFTAKDLVGNTTAVEVQVERTVGAAANVAVEIPNQIVAGSEVEMKIVVTDATGAPVEVDPESLNVAIGGEIGTYADGKFTASQKAGKGTITVTYGDLEPAVVEVEIVPGPLAKLVADKTSVAKGEAVTLKPADQYGNLVAAEGIVFSGPSEGAIVSPNGVFIGSKPGKYEVTATLGELTASITIGVYGDVDSLAISAPESVVANGKTKVEVTVAAVDEHGNVVTEFDGDITLNGVGVKVYDKKDAETENQTVKAKDGKATFYIAVERALAGEEVLLTATYDPDLDTDDDEITGEGTIMAVTPVATDLKVTAPKYFPANEAGNVTVSVKVVDQEGVALEESFEVTATVTGPAELENSEDVYVGSSAPAEFILDNSKYVGDPGTITLTFTVEGVATKTATISHVIAGNPAKIALSSEDLSVTADDKVTIKAEIQDRNGVPVPVENDVELTVKLPSNIKSKFNFPATVTVNEGQSSVTFDLETNSKFTGDVVVTVEASGLTSSSITATFTAGEVAKLAFEKAHIVVPVTNPKATYTVYLADAKDNPVPVGDKELAISVEDSGDLTNIVKVNGKSTDKEPVKLKTGADGKVTFEVSALPYTDKTYTVVVEYGTVASAEGTFEVQTSVVETVAVKLYKKVNIGGTDQFTTATSQDADGEIYVKVSVKDNFGIPVTGIAGDLKLVADEVLGGVDAYGNPALVDGSNVAFIEYNDTDADPDVVDGLDLKEGDYYAVVKAGKAGLQSIGVKYAKAQEDVTRSVSINMRPGTLESIVVNDGKKIEAKKGEVVGPFTLQLADKYGNAVSLSASKKIKWTVEDEESNPSNAITLRTSSGGATVSELTTKSKVNFYLVATDTGTFTITFFVEGEDVDREVTVEVK